MQAINPFAVLGVDESASREEIDDARRRLVRAHHPDGHAAGSCAEQEAAAERMAEVNYAYGLLTDPAKAAAHKRTIDRLRAAGHDVGSPSRTSRDAPDPAHGKHVDYRKAAAAEFTVGNRRGGKPWTARPAQSRRFRTDQ